MNLSLETVLSSLSRDIVTVFDLTLRTSYGPSTLGLSFWLGSSLSSARGSRLTNTTCPTVRGWAGLAVLS